MMRLGSVILKVAPRQVADRMWYFDLLKPYHDHIPVKADLSDLGEKIAWCRANDDKCRIIGENAKVFYEKYIARSAFDGWLLRRNGRRLHRMVVGTADLAVDKSIVGP